ncbi:MAG: HPP family protein [Pelistega sp.]|nr:HPP family protein [Pelistega sp.]
MKILENCLGAKEARPPRVSVKTILFAWLGGLLATAAIAGTGDATQLPLVLGSFGASCLLVFAYPSSPFAQPRNVVGGHVIATVTGLIIMGICGVHWWSMALGVGTAIALMLIFRVPHPPAGSNPLIVMLGAADWWYVVTPTLLGSIILVVVALIFNNWGQDRRYPTYW